MSAKIPTNSSSTTNTTKEVQPPKSREPSADVQQRYGASAYMGQSEYDAYKQPTNMPRQVASNEPTYSNYPSTTNNENRKPREVHYQTDDHSNNQQQQQYTKPSSTSYPGLLGRSYSYNSLQPGQGQPRVTSAKQRNVPSGSSLYQVIILERRNELIDWDLEIK